MVSLCLCWPMTTRQPHECGHHILTGECILNYLVWSCHVLTLRAVNSRITIQIWRAQQIRRHYPAYRVQDNSKPDDTLYCRTLCYGFRSIPKCPWNTLPPSSGLWLFVDSFFFFPVLRGILYISSVRSLLWFCATRCQPFIFVRIYTIVDQILFGCSNVSCRIASSKHVPIKRLL